MKNRILTLICGVFAATVMLATTRARAEDETKGLEVTPAQEEASVEKRFKGYEYDSSEAASNSSEITGELIKGKADRLNRLPSGKKTHN